MLVVDSTAEKERETQRGDRDKKKEFFMMPYIELTTESSRKMEQK